LRKLVAGGTNRSYGIQVARLAGIPARVISRAKKILYNIEQGEYASTGFSCLSNENEPSMQGPVQLDLFRKPEKMVIDRLNKADISGMTPLEALNFLNELQQKVKT
ncbi:MAG: DNA mismatch repair protein MutS, partial [bacterium]|nr:DNA mismatch repair protein MutS [bacterium]